MPNPPKKTKIQLASDLHREFYHQENWDLLMEQFKGQADVLVLAGDIVPLVSIDDVRDTLGAFCDRYKHVIYLPGNHEFYDTDPNTAMVLLGAVENELYNLTVLKNNVHGVGDLIFYGGTMWFPDLPTNWRWKKQLNDFRYIRRFEPWVYEQNRAFHAGLRGLGPNHIVVSHHLPSLRSSPERFRGMGLDSLNAFFVDANAEELISVGSPKLWLHGHTHTACDWMAGSTRVVCAPFGYPFEMTDFPQPVILEV